MHPLFKGVKDLFSFKRSGDFDLKTGSGWKNFFMGGTTNANVSVNQNSAMRFGAVWSCVHLISRTLSTLKIELIEYDGDKKKITTNSALSLLTLEANREQSSVEFPEYFVAVACTWGRSIAHIQRNERTMEAESLRLLDPSQTTRITGASISADLAGRVFYKDNTTGEIYSTDDLLIFDFFYGKSPIQTHREAIGLGIASQDYFSKMIGHGASMGGVVEYDKPLNAEQREALRENIADHAFGLNNGNFGKPLVLDANGKFKPTSLPPNDMQYIQTREFQGEEICRIYGVPPNMAGFLGKATYNNTEQENIRWVQSSVRPWVKKIEVELSRKLLTYKERQTKRFKFNLESLLRGDLKTKSEHIDKMVGKGIYSINDGRKFLDMDPVEGGDQNFIQVNQIPIDMAEDYAATLINKLQENGE